MDYNVLLSQLNKRNFKDFFGVHRELKYVAKNISAREEVLAAVRGYTGGATVLCVITHRRLWFVNVRMVHGVQSSEIPIRMINAVSYSNGFYTCDLVITNGADNTVVNGVLKREAKQFVDVVDDILLDFQNGLNYAQSQTSVADELEKLKSLLDAGVLTQVEFDQQKEKLLNR